MNKTNAFLDALEALKQQPLPASVVHRTKLALLDYIGVTLAGRQEHRAKADALAASFHGGGTVRAIGMDTALSLNDAAFLNGLNGHALDFDDPLSVESTPLICTISISQTEFSSCSTTVTGLRILSPLPSPSP